MSKREEDRDRRRQERREAEFRAKKEMKERAEEAGVENVAFSLEVSLTKLSRELRRAR